VPENDDEDVFVPLRPLLGSGLRDRRERERERGIAERVDRHREHRGQPPRRVRGLSRADIVSTAIAIADADGTEAVSMRRIARELRAGAMSLYWYVSSKEELHQLMLAKVQAESEAPEPSGDWRADLRTYARNARAALLRHPWAMDFMGNGPPSGPNDAANMERLISALDGLGLDIATTMYILTTLGTYVLGAALREVQEIRWHAVAAETSAGLTEGEIAELMDEFDRRIRQSGHYPHMVRIMDEDFDPDAPQTRDQRFEFGLDCVLDGVAARLPAT
jgi:AcrR family transcriptional regulator